MSHLCHSENTTQTQTLPLFVWRCPVFKAACWLYIQVQVPICSMHKHACIHTHTRTHTLTHTHVPSGQITPRGFGCMQLRLWSMTSQSCEPVLLSLPQLSNYSPAGGVCPEPLEETLYSSFSIISFSYRLHPGSTTSSSSSSSPPSFPPSLPWLPLQSSLLCPPLLLLLLLLLLCGAFSSVSHIWQLRALHH